jgi:hypothetical protein
LTRGKRANGEARRPTGSAGHESAANRKLIFLYLIINPESWPNVPDSLDFYYYKLFIIDIFHISSFSNYNKL